MAWLALWSQSLWIDCWEHFRQSHTLIANIPQTSHVWSEIHPTRRLLDHHTLVTCLSSVALSKWRWLNYTPTVSLRSSSKFRQHRPDNAASLCSSSFTGTKISCPSSSFENPDSTTRCNSTAIHTHVKHTHTHIALPVSPFVLDTGPMRLMTSSSDKSCLSPPSPYRPSLLFYLKRENRCP